MRILGSCPNCNKLDTIFVVYHENEVARCTNCPAIWENWSNLIADERGEGKRLIPVEIQRAESRYGAVLAVKLVEPPKSAVPFADIILSILHAALLVKYPRLRPNLACEGGVMGRVGTGYVELVNCDECIGLSDELAFDRNGGFDRETAWVLGFYENMLRRIFKLPLKFRGRKMRPGAILWLPAAGVDSELDAWQILKLILRKVGGPQFPEAVAAKLREVGTLGRIYLRGLKDEEIVRIFVPPPGFDEITGRRET